jgi:hypothetical protein
MFSYFQVRINLVRLFNIFLNETFSKARKNKYFSNSFLIQNSPKQGDSLLQQIFKFALEYFVGEGP